MPPLDLALAEVMEDTLNVAEVARKDGVVRTTLWKQYTRRTRSAIEKSENQSLLSHQQERTLVRYIKDLSERGLPPTPSMLRNFVHDIVKIWPGKGWCSRFCKRWN